MIIGLTLALTQTFAPNPNQWAPFPAPEGFHWEFVFYDLDRSTVLDDLTGRPIVSLVEN